MEKTQELLRPGVSNLFCSSLCVPTAFKGTSPSYLNHRKVCLLSLFDLYLQRCLFCCRSSLHFDKCSLADLPSMITRGLHLPETGPRGERWEGFLHHDMAAGLSPASAALLCHQPKPLLGHLHSVGQALAAHLCLATSLPSPALYPWTTIQNLCMFLCSNPQSQLIPFMDPSKILPITINLQLPSNMPSLCTATALPHSLLRTMHLSWPTTLPLLSFS